jgi:hypothetical protein
MVAVIHSGSSLRTAVNYNEQKVSRGVARCIDAGYYLKDVQDLSFQDKVSRLQNLIDLNSRVKVNTLHVSLNFAAQDRLDSAALKEIAGVYLEKIGFENQPYLLYEHLDAAHQHVHIVTTNIRSDGRSINLHNIGKIRSEAARKQIENEYSLVRAEDHKRPVFKLLPVPVSVAEYGRSQTKQAISNIVQTVIKDYHFTSLSELNAVLAQYRVQADAGAEGSRVRANQGLVFRMLDPRGERVGVPIKASDFHFKPTLKNLQTRFEKGAASRKGHAIRLKNTVDMTLARRGAHSLDAFAVALRAQGVSVIARASQTGEIYGLTYVDHRTKSVFNGSDLGKAYSAKAVQQTLHAAADHAFSSQPMQIQQVADGFSQGSSASQHAILDAQGATGDDLFSELLQPQRGETAMPWQIRKPRRKTKRKSI